MLVCGSFWGPDQKWDWEQDAGQRWVLLQARRRGACLFEAFSNSPPYWMTNSGRASGNTFAWLGEQWTRLALQLGFAHQAQDSCMPGKLLQMP